MMVPFGFDHIYIMKALSRMHSHILPMRGWDEIITNKKTLINKMQYNNYLIVHELC